MTRYLSIILLLTLTSCERSQERSVFLGKDYARKALSDALADTVDILPVDKVLIENEQTAIDFAEVVLFKVYGHETIEDERPSIFSPCSPPILMILPPRGVMWKSSVSKNDFGLQSYDFFLNDSPFNSRR
jgi:hypothetical protein